MKETGRMEWDVAMNDFTNKQASLHTKDSFSLNLCINVQERGFCLNKWKWK